MPDLPLAQPRLALFDNPAFRPTAVQRLGLALVGVGGVAGVVALASDLGARHPLAFSLAFLGGLSAGGVVYALGGLARSAGVHNEGTMFSSNEARGAVGWTVGVVLTGLYVVLYFWPAALGGLIPLGDPLSRLVRGMPATLANGGQWFLYSTLYTLAVLVMGVRAFVRYRHSRYHLVRTVSVVFFQTVIAFALPYVLVRLQEPELYLHYTWPLDFDLFFPWKVAELREAGQLGVAMVVWGAVLLAVVTPVLTYFFGKRWYCSWVCGCGGLAETAGDPYRHLSDKGLTAWRVERWMVHGVLALIVAGTALLWVAAVADVAWLDATAGTFSWLYGLLIGSVFAGVVGVGFYPIMGSRVWCRFGCPMAAILGLQQRFFSRFRITTNGGQCISCGQCSAYCEMGIDVKWYAQRGQNVVRAACVGCGICATVCPRGVLRLENGPDTSGPSRAGRPVNNLIADLDILDDALFETAPPAAGPPVGRGGPTVERAS
ncbi:4Fe-4S binding protein [Rubrivirga sp. S365]|uniref:4Fe-4S binding protein n=1 Tax=Rubrivirga litoralis TaxID=3075598 RepID=A0ABU3BU30_9BACT|nr:MULTISPECIES: 4Fe-4S dicluster domain-containing protein [unclassified Rubrivirga]MDT0632794.1 4Fe-4S binding protein [Rubrivirga sp. F394]MDT7857484.1 4Fe-4S binding protein [Rubrivirga sp. S365]